MIDFVKFYHFSDNSIHFKEILPTEKYGFIFNPNYNQQNRVNNFIHKNELGFCIKIFYDKVQFEGSLHKLYNRLNRSKGNDNDFTFNQLSDSVNWLENLFGINATEFTITSMEIGINLQLKFSPEFYLNLVANYKKTKSFSPLQKGNKVYGKKVFLSQYELKLYDKTFESEVHQNKYINKNILRFEVGSKKMQIYKGLNINTLNDLKQIEKFNGIGDFLLNKFNGIEFEDHFIDTSNLDSSERALFYASKNESFWIDEKKANPKGQHNIKAKYESIKKKLYKESKEHTFNLVFELKNAVKNKLLELTN